MQCPGSSDNNSETKREVLSPLNGISSQDGVSVTYNHEGELVLSDNVSSSGRTIGKDICSFVVILDKGNSQ